MIEKIMEFGEYVYGTSDITGIPSQPKCINIFTKAIENNVEKFREYTLFPACYHRQRIPFVGTVEGIKTIHETRLRSREMNCLQRTDNILRGLAAFLPVIGGGILLLSDYHINFSHNSDEILQHKDVKEKKAIAGFAIEGRVIKTIPLKKLDNIIPDLDMLTNERRLSILTEHFKSILKKMGVEEEKEKHPLPPVDKILTSALDGIDRKKSTDVDITEIRKRWSKITERKDVLTTKQALEIDEIGCNMCEIANEYHVKKIEQK